MPDLVLNSSLSVLIYVLLYIFFINFRFDWCAHVILSCMLCASCSLVRLVGVERARIGGKCLAHVLADRRFDVV